MELAYSDSESETEQKNKQVDEKKQKTEKEEQKKEVVEAAATTTTTAAAAEPAKKKKLPSAATLLSANVPGPNFLKKQDDEFEIQAFKQRVPPPADDAVKTKRKFSHSQMLNEKVPVVNEWAKEMTRPAFEEAYGDDKNKGKALSFNQREKRKRDIGQGSGSKNFIEEEKRMLRQSGMD